MRSCVAIVALVACSEAEPPAPAPPAPAPRPSVVDAASAVAGCEPLPFPESSPVPEASGAAWLDVDGKLALVVVSDSGHDGAYSVIDPESGATRERGKLPLGNASDDIEGLASRGDALYGLTSAGWMRVWKRKGKGFELVDGPYAIGPIDAQSKTGGKAPKGVGNVCPAKLGNCGRNFEGLAMSATAAYACAKTDGRLYPLVEQNGRFAGDFTTSIAVTKPDAIGDCAFSDRGVLLVGENWFGQVYRVDLPSTVTPLGQIAVGFPEVIAARGDILYRMSDMGGSPSLMAKFRCPAIAR